MLFTADRDDPARHAPNALREFLRFLKISGQKGRAEFTFAGRGESLHRSLSIKENYMLDSIPTSLIKKKEDNFTELAESLANSFLKSLVEATEPLDRKLLALERSEKKLVSVVKALLGQSEFIFLDCPEQDMSPEHLDAIKSALSFEAAENGRKVYIRAANSEVWLDIATHFVCRDQGNAYSKTENAMADANNGAGENHVFEPVKKAG